MPTPRPIIAAIGGVKSGIERHVAEQVPTSAEPTPRPNSAVPIGRPIASTEPKARIRMMTAASTPSISLAGSSNSREQLAAVLDDHALGQVERVAFIADGRAEVGELLERAVTDVEGGEGDRAVLGDLLGPVGVERAGDRDALLRRGDVEDLLQRGAVLRVVDAAGVLDHDLGGEAGTVRVARLQQLLHVLGLTAGQA